MIDELKLFGIFCLIGIGAGLVYDGFRFFRRLFPHNLLWLSIEDILFWSAMGGAIYGVFFVKSGGVLRIYGLIGVAAGILIYAVCISPLFFQKMLIKAREWSKKHQKKKSKKSKKSKKEEGKENNKKKDTKKKKTKKEKLKKPIDE